MEILLIILLTFLAILFLVVIRNELVYSIRMRAISILYKTNRGSLWRQLEYNPGYYTMIMDLTKWTFGQFYPQLANEGD